MVYVLRHKLLQYPSPLMRDLVACTHVVGNSIANTTTYVMPNASNLLLTYIINQYTPASSPFTMFSEYAQTSIDGNMPNNDDGKTTKIDLFLSTGVMKIWTN